MKWPDVVHNAIQSLLFVLVLYVFASCMNGGLLK